MTYCTVAQVGNVRFGKAKAEGSIEHVLRAAELLDLFLGFKGLYDPSSTWDHSPIDIGFEADGQIIVPLRYPCISVSQIQRYSSSYTLLDTISPALSDHYANTYLARADSGFQSGDGLKVTGVRGHARLKALDADDEVVAGQSVLRDGAVVIFEEDGVAIADDDLLVAPQFLQGAATTIARRLVRLERDQEATWDDGGTSRSPAGNTLFDGYLPVLTWYR